MCFILHEFHSSEAVGVVPLKQELGKDKGSVLRHIEGEYPGISQPMLYIGSLFATFYWHVEDHFMHSVNFMHCGAPKTWYGVPGNCAEEFDRVVLRKVYPLAVERLMKEEGVPLEYALATALRTLCNKSTLFSPQRLIDAGSFHSSLHLLQVTCRNAVQAFAIITALLC